MKLFKTIDWIGQLLLIVIGALLALFRKADILSADFTAAYLLVGGWQLLSMLVHLFLPAAVKIKARKYYLWLLALTMLAGVVTGVIIEKAIIGYLFAMLFWTPLLAIFYLVISYKEAKQLQQQ
jgi:hypothetical protein